MLREGLPTTRLMIDTKPPPIGCSQVALGGGLVSCRVGPLLVVSPVAVA